MKRWIAALLLALGSAMVPAAASAKDFRIEPGAAYVVVEMLNLDDAMLKGTKVPGALVLARYDPVKGDVRGGTLSPDTKLAKDEPVRVTLQGKPMAKSKTGRLFVVKLEPDTWVVEGANGTAFSLGSVAFTLAPGEILDLGVFKPSVDWVEGEGPKSMVGGLMGAALFGSVGPKEQRPIRIEWRVRGSGDLPLPPELAGHAVTPAALESDRKFGNYLGGLVNRFGGRAARPGAQAAATAATAGTAD